MSENTDSYIPEEQEETSLKEISQPENKSQNDQPEEKPAEGLTQEEVQKAAQHLSEVFATRDPLKIQQATQLLSESQMLDNPFIVQTMEENIRQLDRLAITQIKEAVDEARYKVLATAKRLFDNPKIVQLTMGPAMAQENDAALKHILRTLSINEATDMQNLPARLKQATNLLQEMNDRFQRKKGAYEQYSRDPRAGQAFLEQIRMVKNLQNNVVEELREELRPSLSRHQELIASLPPQYQRMSRIISS